MTAAFVIIGQVAAGWFLADLAGGLFHWFIDHLAPSVWPIAGIVRDFREHHDDRHSMEKYSRVPSLVLGLVGSLPVVVVAHLAGLDWLAGTLLVGAALTQHSHYYAHVLRPPAWAKLLQQAGLFLSPAAHERHHSDFFRSYGVLNGWSHGTADLVLGRRY